LSGTEDVIFDRRRKKIVFGDNDEDNDNDNDYMPDDFDSDSEDNEYEVILTVNGSDAHENTTLKSACDTQGIIANAEDQRTVIANAEDQGAATTNSTTNPGGRPRNKEWFIGGDECNVEGVVESYYSNSQSLHTSVNYENEQEITSIPKYPTFNEALHLKDSKPEVGMKFKDPVQFRGFIRYYGCENGYNFKYPKNESDRTLTVCKVDGYPFRAFAS